MTLWPSEPSRKQLTSTRLNSLRSGTRGSQLRAKGRQLSIWGAEAQLRGQSGQGNSYRLPSSLSLGPGGEPKKVTYLAGIPCMRGNDWGWSS